MLIITDHNDRGNDRTVQITGDYDANIASFATAINSTAPDVVLWVARKVIDQLLGTCRDEMVEIHRATTSLLKLYNKNDELSGMWPSAHAAQVHMSGLAYRLLYDALCLCELTVTISRDELNRKIDEQVTYM